jgi:hypothetical protein
MFPRNGVYVPDSEMPAVTHLNEFHNVCVEQVTGKSSFTGSLHWLVLLNGTQEDRVRSEQCIESLEPNWNGDGKDCGMSGFFPSYRSAQDVSSWPWVSEPTAAVAFPSTNPGHFVSDVLWTLTPRFSETDPFTQTYLADDPGCERWQCWVTQVYYKLKTRRPSRILRATGPTCFKTLYIPQLTRWRWQPDDVPNFEVLTSLRTALAAGFGPPKDNVLIYTHEDGIGRQWSNSAEFQQFLEEKGYHVNRITSFSALRPEQQCQAFYDAKVILVPHGGQMGNLLCARNGTRSIEMTCDEGLGWFTTAIKYQAVMGFSDRHLPIPQEFCSTETEKNRFKQSWSFPVDQLWSKMSELGVFA